MYNLLTLPPFIALLIMFNSFIMLWVGPDFSQAVLGGRLFLFSVIVAIPLKIFSHSLVAKGRVKEIGWSKFIFSIINVIASIILVIKIGLIGVIIPTVENTCG